MKGKTLAILGSGHLGQQIAHYAVADHHYDNIVYFDDFTSDKLRDGFEILGNSIRIEQEFANKSFDEMIIALGYNHLTKKKELFDRFIDVIPFGKIIHSSSWVDESAIVGAGCVIYPRCIVDANVVIEKNSILNIGCTIAHDTTIGEHCFLSPRVALAGFVKVENSCIIGINATIIDNVTITSKTQIGGGAVVIKNITSAGLYVGNPCRFIR
ncbi:acetyltransferase [Flavobacterium frigidarium]|uniref:acetyltransferase n=1 Tax=Flavobacterium frigidarium TaxID=99286 RepID=UPI000421FBAA|nr:acetyltransferase [Flavobacterium frigidarium]